MKLFKNKKKEKLSKNMIKFIESLEKYEQDQNQKPFSKRNIYPTITDAQLVVDCLCDLLLGEDWYVTDPLPNGQVNTIILDEILYKYFKPYRDYIEEKKSH